MTLCVNEISMSPAFLKKAILTVSLMVILSSCATTSSNKDKWLSADKAWHFGAGAAIGGIATKHSLDNGKSKSKALAIGVSVIIPLGAAKEATDIIIRKSYWSWKDFTWNVIGATVGSLAVEESQ